jgi:hypothetical protein
MEKKNAIIQILKDQFIQTWSSDAGNSPKSKIYRIFKADFGFEKYLEKLQKKKLRTIFLTYCTIAFQ